MSSNVDFGHLTFSCNIFDRAWVAWHRLIRLARANSRSCPEAHPLLSCRALHVWLLRLVLLGCRAGPMTCWYLLSLFLLASLPVALLFVSVGSDFWTEAEKSLFSAALQTYGKEFPLIQKMVRSHSLSRFFMQEAHASSLFMSARMLSFLPKKSERIKQKQNKQIKTL